MKRSVRIFARLVITPVLVLGFGFVWLGWMVLVFPTLRFIAFVAEHPFEWSSYWADANEFFMEPIRDIWGLNE